MSNTIHIIAFATCVAFAPPADSAQPRSTIDAVVARARAVVSGRLTYTWREATLVGEQVVRSKALPEATFTFSDSSWTERRSGSPVIMVNHNGQFLDYAATPQPAGTVNHRINIQDAHGRFDRDNEANVPPIFAGSLWSAPQLTYVQLHAREFRQTGHENVNAVPTDVYELDVPAEDYRKAYHYLMPALEPGGIIRLFVAPQLGYVLPRYEYLTTQGAVAQSYDATGFAEVAPAVYLPKHIEANTNPAAGRRDRFKTECDLRAELINEPIPEEEFVIQLPVGTSVHDGRDAEHVVAFVIKDPAPSSELDDLSWAASGRKPRGFFQRWRNAILLGIVLGIVAAAASVMTARQRRRAGSAGG